MMSIAVLISGRGSNLQALLEAEQSVYHVSLVLSDKEDAPGLQHAKRHGIATQTFPRSRFATKSEQKEAIYAAITKENPKLIALAGFMQIVEASFVNAWYGRLINIHPSLLPKYPGLETHRRALDAKEKLHGCTVHFVDSGVDSGPVIAQSACPILDNDSEESLSERVLFEEHRLYPWVATQLAQGNIELKERHTYFSAEARASAAKNSFLLPD